jgi:hypothetical protein
MLRFGADSLTGSQMSRPNVTGPVGNAELARLFFGYVDREPFSYTLIFSVG